MTRKWNLEIPLEINTCLSPQALWTSSDIHFTTTPFSKLRLCVQLFALPNALEAISPASQIHSNFYTLILIWCSVLIVIVAISAFFTTMHHLAQLQLLHQKTHTHTPVAQTAHDLFHSHKLPHFHSTSALFCCVVFCFVLFYKKALFSSICILPYIYSMKAKAKATNLNNAVQQLKFEKLKEKRTFTFSATSSTRPLPFPCTK